MEFLSGRLKVTYANFLVIRLQFISGSLLPNLFLLIPSGKRHLDSCMTTLKMTFCNFATILVRFLYDALDQQFATLMFFIQLCHSQKGVNL